MTAAGRAVVPPRAEVAADVPVDPDRDTAREWAVEELSRPEYDAADPGPLARALRWLYEQITEALDRVPGNGSALLAAVTGLAALAVVLLVVRLVAGPVRRTTVRGARGDLYGGVVRTAAEHREAAAGAAAAGRWREAVQETFRATARSLEERALLDVRAGRTAGEVALEGGREVPAVAADLRAAADLFDDVTYGDRPGDRAGYERLVAADRALAAARPAALAASGGLAPPR